MRMCGYSLLRQGGLLGCALSQGESTTLGCAMPCATRDGFFGFKRFRNNKDKRDFITAGVACGVAVAFGCANLGLALTPPCSRLDVARDAHAHTTREKTESLAATTGK
jgi:hypothetical protein